MKRLFPFIAALLALFCSVTLAGAVQETSDLDTDDLVGLESAYNRQYMTDPNSADIEDPATVYTAMISVFTYDTPEHARQAIDDHAGEFLIIHFGNSDAEAEEVDGVGDYALSWSGTTDLDGAESPTDLIMFQHGDMVIMIWTIGGDSESGTELTQEIADWMLKQEITDEAVDLDTGGESTGGPFDLMPAEEISPDLMAMIPYQDGDIVARAEGSATPED